MTLLAWPLERNEIRRGIRNNAFGMVRNGGTRPHQGWDLYAPVGTPCYAIADGTIEDIDDHPSFGRTILLQFAHLGQTLYAAYCHLSATVVFKAGQVRKGSLVGFTGSTGNAVSMRGDDEHLHFEIRTVPHPGLGLAGRIDPVLVYGRAPLGWAFFEGHGQKLLYGTSGATGLKVPGVNVRERIE